MTNTDINRSINEAVGEAGKQAHIGDQTGRRDCRELIALCRGHRVIIQTHNFPDADALSSAFGLQYIFRQSGVEAEITFSGDLGTISMQRFVDTQGIHYTNIEAIQDTVMPDDILVYVDCQKTNGNLSVLLPQQPSACIDHHPVFMKTVYLYEAISQVGACASLIAAYFRDLGLTPPENIATALLYGIKIDTRNFTRGVTALDLDMHRYLFDYIDQEKIRILDNTEHELTDLKAWGQALENIRMVGDLGYSSVPYSCPDAMIASMSDFILTVDGINVFVMFSEREDGVKLSVRTKLSEINAGLLIMNALKGVGSGGGHAYMAGGFIPKQSLSRLNGPYDHVILQRLQAEMAAMRKA